MNNHQNKWMRSFYCAAILIGLGGCLGGEELNSERAVYQPEEKPLSVIASEDIEVKPGDEVTLSARLVGTTNGQTVLWTQTGGETVELSSDNTMTVSFNVPDSLLSGLLSFSVAVFETDGTATLDENGDPLVDGVDVSVFDPDSVIVMDAGDSETILNGVQLVTNGDDAYIQGANNDTHTADIEPGMSVVFPVIAESGFYTLNVRYAIPSDYGGKVAGVNVNGIDYALEFDATGQWEEIRVGVVELREGTNTIEVGGGWNYYRIDSISLIPASEPPAPLPVPANLVVSDASQSAQDLMQFLSDNYLVSTLSGQTEFPSKKGDEFPLLETQKIIDVTGDDSPAIIAFDYMNYSASYNGTDASGLTESIIAHRSSQNFIVSALFHWRAPSGNTGNGDGSFYTDGTTFNVAMALSDTESEEYAQLLTDMDTVAEELKKLQEADIVVLWRPLHEAQGGWFWWGAQGAEAFKQLWSLMFDRYTNHHGLNNLIWVFTHTDGLGEDWYPGDDMVDIVGFDGYGEPRNDDTHTFVTQYKTLQDRHNARKMVALTETGTIPDVALMHEQEAMWSFFITWNSEPWDPDSVIGPQGADPVEVDENYAFDGVLNAEDVPGGRERVKGTYADFEVPVGEWEAQVNWAPTDGLQVSDLWSDSGAYALAITKDMTQIETLDNVVMQTYPEGGIDVSGASELTLTAVIASAGSNVVAHIFFKAPDGVESWPEAVPVSEEGTQLSIDVSEVDTINGLGVRFMGLSGDATEATYAIDNIALDGTQLIDFEPDVGGWHSQVSWSNAPGTTISRAWASDGEQSLAFYHDLAALGSATDIVLQNYPEGGIDVADISTLSVIVNAGNAGPAVDAHLFFKAPDGVESWPAAITLADGGTELSIDVSDVDVLNGIGIRFNGVDPASTNAHFHVDTLALDTRVFESFERTGEFELQVNWSPVDGLTLGDGWSDSGIYSLKGEVSISNGDEVILQTYPADGILLASDVSTLTVVAHVATPSAETTAKLWAKDQDGAWRDAGAIAVTGEPVQLSLDISDLSELQGFGVQFQGLTSDQSTFYIDTISFE
ncbi:glycosyl hydrolase [Alteromonas oceanisediminis]|uniref:glycosyl hydrolase n=1 Tax=Alteromonas oceanisediminis TaxID=2836180 RepID=UPI001BDAD4B3|nr:glycosyl hydrolase [Alteromonas oceanisediminis]MBT0586816.1 mannan endo-1,4-beta-mannosidase [Alteromonas oceanisediminis]